MRKQVTLAILLMLSVLPATARSWKPQGAALAQDYSVITDSRPNREIVQIIWLTWPMTNSNSPVVRELLDKYVIVGLSHGQFDAGGKLVFSNEEGAEASDLSGTILKPISEGGYPPSVIGVVSTIGAAMRQSMGALGAGMKFSVFDSGNVRACDKGRLTLRYAGETYYYDTPIPGCPAP